MKTLSATFTQPVQIVHLNLLIHQVAILSLDFLAHMNE